MSNELYFEDFYVGQKFQSEISAKVSAAEIKEFGQRYDPQPFHLDEAAAARSHFGGLIASGWHTAAVCLRLLVEDRHRRQAELRGRGEPVRERRRVDHGGAEVEVSEHVASPFPKIDAYDITLIERCFERWSKGSPVG